MRVVNPHQHAQQRSGSGCGQRDPGEAGPHHGKTDGQAGGQGGVVAGERPVSWPGAFRDGFGARAYRTARTLLVHDELHRFAHRIRSDGAEAGQYGSGNPSWVLAADCRRPHPDQQHSEDHQSALGGHFQEGPQPRRCIRRRPGHRPVHRRRSATRDLHRTGLAQPTGGQPSDCSGTHAQDGQRAEQSTGSDFPSRFSFHEAERRSGDPRGARAERQLRTLTIVRVDRDGQAVMRPRGRGRCRSARGSMCRRRRARRASAYRRAAARTA